MSGCGSSTCYGHGDYARCGQPYINGIYECGDCKVKRLTAIIDLYDKFVGAGGAMSENDLHAAIAKIG
jgi:hypothetical protein